MNYEKFPDKCSDELKTMFPQMVFFEPLFDESIIGINLEENRVVYSESGMQNIIDKERYFDKCTEVNFRYLNEDLEGDISEIDFYDIQYEYWNKINNWFNQIKHTRDEVSLKPLLCDELFQSRCTYAYEAPKINDFDGIVDDLPF